MNLRVPYKVGNFLDGELQLNGRNTPFLNDITYPGVILHMGDDIETPYLKDCSRGPGHIQYIRIYSLFKSDPLNNNMKLTIHKALIRSIMVYACYTREYAADAHFLKPEHLQNRVLCAIGYFDRRTPVRETHMAFKIPYVYDYINLCTKQAEVIQNNIHQIVRANGQGEAMHSITVLAASHVVTATNGRTFGPTIYSYNRHSVYNVVDNY
jgi:hypothetical protein